MVSQIRPVQQLPEDPRRRIFYIITTNQLFELGIMAFVVLNVFALMVR